MYYPGFGPDNPADNYQYQNGQLHKVTVPGNDYLSLHYEGDRGCQENVYRSGGVHTYSWEYIYRNGRPAGEKGTELYEGGWYRSLRRE